MSVEFTIEGWGELFWSHYTPIIASGAPFHLAADKALIKKLQGRNREHQPGDSVSTDSFHSLCADLLEFIPKRRSQRARILEVAFERKANGRSLAICLAVQQVLVVEEMVEDEGISRNAYFPRYRSRLGLLNLKSSNPLLGGGFSRIWKTLEAEIRAVEGSGISSVTFGPGKGLIDRNRNYPLSQALLSHADVVAFRGIAASVSQDSSNEAIMSELFRRRTALSRRGQSLAATNHEWLIERLCEQIRAFSGGATAPESLKRASARLDQPRLVAYYNEFDLLAEKDFFEILIESGDKHVGGDDAREVIERRIRSEKRVFLQLNGDIYKEVRPSRSVVPGEPILVLQEAVASLESSIEHGDLMLDLVEFHSVETSFPDLISAVRKGSASEADLLKVLGSGAFRSDGLRFVGGLRPDEKTHAYIRGYPPQGICVAGELVPREALISVDNVEICCGDFFDGLAKKDCFSSYTIKYEGKSIQLAVCSLPLPRTAGTIGYAVHEESLAASCSRHEPDSIGLFGLFLAEASVFQDRTVEALPLDQLKLLLKRERRISIKPEDASLLLKALALVEQDFPVAGAIRKQIKLSGSIPVGAYLAGLGRAVCGRNQSEFR